MTVKFAEKYALTDTFTEALLTAITPAIEVLVTIVGALSSPMTVKFAEKVELPMTLATLLIYTFPPM